MLNPEQRAVLEAERADLAEQLTRVTNAIERENRDDYIDERVQQEIPFATAVAMAARIGIDVANNAAYMTSVYLKNGARITCESSCNGPYSDVTADCDLNPPVCKYYPRGS